MYCLRQAVPRYRTVSTYCVTQYNCFSFFNKLENTAKVIFYLYISKGFIGGSLENYKRIKKVQNIPTFLEKVIYYYKKLFKGNLKQSVFLSRT